MGAGKGCGAAAAVSTSDGPAKQPGHPPPRRLLEQERAWTEQTPTPSTPAQHPSQQERACKRPSFRAHSEQKGRL